MKKINNYGLKMVGLKKASSATVGINSRAGMYTQISYDREDGQILTSYHVSYGGNSWTQYNDGSIVTVCNADSHMTMQDISDAIYQRLQMIAV